MVWYQFFTFSKHVAETHKARITQMGMYTKDSIHENKLKQIKTLPGRANSVSSKGKFGVKPSSKFVP